MERKSRNQELGEQIVKWGDLKVSYSEKPLISCNPTSLRYARLRFVLSADCTDISCIDMMGFVSDS
jgi:hypothetical protein